MPDMNSNVVLDIEPKTRHQFDIAIQYWKAKVATYGFSQAAIDSFSFTVEKYSSESRGGRPPFLNDKPHYEMKISIPYGDNTDVRDWNLPFAQRSIPSQAYFLFCVMHLASSSVFLQAAEILTKRLKDELNEELKEPGYRVVTGSSISLGRSNHKSSAKFQCNPSVLMNTITELTEHGLSLEVVLVSVDQIFECVRTPPSRKDRRFTP